MKKKNVPCQLLDNKFSNYSLEGMYQSILKQDAELFKNYKKFCEYTNDEVNLIEDDINADYQFKNQPIDKNILISTNATDEILIDITSLEAYSKIKLNNFYANLDFKSSKSQNYSWILDEQSNIDNNDTLLSDNHDNLSQTIEIQINKVETLKNK